MAKKSQISQKNKTLLKKAERQYRLTDPFKRWMILPNTNKPIRLDKIKLSDAEKALEIVLRQAAEDLIKDADKNQQRENEAMPLTYVILFKWGQFKAEELLPTLLTYLRNIRKEHHLSDDEIKAIIKKKSLTVLEVAALFEVDRHTVWTWEKQGLKRDASGKRFDINEVFRFTKTLPRQKSRAEDFVRRKRDHEYNDLLLTRGR